MREHPKFMQQADSKSGGVTGWILLEFIRPHPGVETK
jgi:hypothetical protein